MKLNEITILGVFLVFILTSVTFADENFYTVGPGDVLEISVWKDESLSREVVVPPDGIISLPLIGDIDTQNMTVTDIRKIVTNKFQDYVQDAVVTVMLSQINSMHAFVIGKVNKPGVYPILMDTNVMQMLSKAGGLNPFASEKNIHILRPLNNETHMMPFDYKEVLKGVNLKQNIFLKRGDVIVVP